MNEVLSCANSADNGKVPRIVAAKIKKTTDYSGNCRVKSKPRIAGDLRVTENSICYLRYAEICDGSLILYRYNGSSKEWVSRIALYNLNISLDSPKGGQNQFTLSKYGEVTPIVTLQVLDEKDYNAWVKALVVEVIRQTPLNTMKFLDILLISELLDKRTSYRHVCENSIVEKSPEKSTAYDNKAIDFIEDDLQDGHSVGHVFELNVPISANNNLDILKPSNSYDSGFCSLRCEEQAEEFKSAEKEDVKPKVKLRRADSFKANFSNSCSNLINKFKRSNTKENESSQKNIKSAPKQQSFTADCVMQNANKSRACQKEDSSCAGSDKTRSRIVDRGMTEVENEHCLPRRKDRDAESEVMQQRRYPQESQVFRELSEIRTKCNRYVTFQLPEKMLENRSASSLVRLLTKCQIDKEYVPVKEKKLLFESLSRFSFSVDNLKKREAFRKVDEGKLPKSSSLYSLNKNTSTVSVKMIKSYFENFSNRTGSSNVTKTGK